jgi:hypothetical protein
MVYGLSFPEQRRSHTNLRAPTRRSAANAERQQKATIVAPILFAVGGAFFGTAAPRRPFSLALWEEGRPSAKSPARDFLTGPHLARRVGRGPVLPLRPIVGLRRHWCL